MTDSPYFANAAGQWHADREAGPIHLDARYRPIADPTEGLDAEGLDRQCRRLYLDTGRRCAGVIAWWRRADTLWCSDRCKYAARDQRRRARASVT